MSIESVECKVTKCQVCGAPVVDGTSKPLTNSEVKDLIDRYDRTRKTFLTLDHGPKMQATLKELLELRRYKVKFDILKQALKDIETHGN